MRTLYEAANAIEAHMLLDLLKQEGFVAYIRGEHLQGAIGELPAGSLVRLEIPEHEFADARGIIDRWEALHPIEAASQKPKKKYSTVIIFLIGLALGIGCTFAYFRTPVTLQGIDYNGDGVLDEKFTYSPSRTLLKIEVDRNLDGKIDYITHYDERGIPKSAALDDNFDGIFETRMLFRAGNLETMETDTGGDGFVDFRSRYVYGVLNSVEYLSPKAGIPLRVESIRLGKIVYADIDVDGDGKLDTRFIYTPLGEVASKGPMPN